MLLRDCFILIGVGLGFVFLGLVGIIWGRHEAKRYDEALSTRHDLREFVSHWPERPQSGALLVGGWIAIALGMVMLVIGIVCLWLQVRPA
jgi:nitrogen fixation-related uncharacterized protein